MVRTTEDMLRLIPNTLREAVVGLGAPKWKMIVLVCWRGADDGIVTGILLGHRPHRRRDGAAAVHQPRQLNWSIDLAQPMPSLPRHHLSLCRLAPSRTGSQLAWVGALLITLAVLPLNIAARSLLRSGE